MSLNHLLEKSQQASKVLNNIILKSPLEYNRRLSKKYNCNIYLKREDQQIMRSFKIRGAFNKIKNLTPTEKNIKELYVQVLKFMHNVLHILVIN